MAFEPTVSLYPLCSFIRCGIGLNPTSVHRRLGQLPLHLFLLGPFDHNTTQSRSSYNFLLCLRKYVNKTRVIRDGLSVVRTHTHTPFLRTKFTGLYSRSNVKLFLGKPTHQSIKGSLLLLSLVLLESSSSHREYLTPNITQRLNSQKAAPILNWLQGLWSGPRGPTHIS
ncbi:hypothetical protein D3C87_1188790 [compost metagenome]